MRNRPHWLLTELKIDLLILGLCILLMLLCRVKAEDSDLNRRVLHILRASGNDPEALELTRGAAKHLRSQGADTLVPLLVAMKSRPLPVVNWLRSVFDEISERELAAGGKRVDRNALRKIAEDQAQSGYARRLALDLLERLEPGTISTFLHSRLNDPEFAADAVAQSLLSAATARDRGDSDSAVAQLKSAFSAAVEPEQVRLIGARLKEIDVEVDVAAHLGTVTHWHVIGPFPGRNMTAVTEVFPPEGAIELAAQYEGKLGPVTWKSVVQGASEDWIDLKKVLGDTDDAIAYAATAVISDREREVEVRAGADDNLQLWLNGEPILKSINFYQRARLDRHRIKVRLKSGTNTLLAKVCEVKLPPGPPSGGPARWQLGLRIVDENGRGVSFPTQR